MSNQKTYREFIIEQTNLKSGYWVLTRTKNPVGLWPEYKFIYGPFSSKANAKDKAAKSDIKNYQIKKGVVDKHGRFADSESDYYKYVKDNTMK